MASRFSNRSEKFAVETMYKQDWHLYFTPRQIAVLLFGFSSGLPLALTASTLTAWLSDAHVEKAGIGLFAAIATPYALKFLWSPLIDGAPFPLLTRIFGQRRGWMLATQILLALAIAAMAFADPANNAFHTAMLALIVAMFSASQDIVIDAFRVERLPKQEQGAGAAMATLGYRIGMLISGAGALWLADHLGWQHTYFIMAAMMGVGIATTLCVREPVKSSSLLEGEVKKEVHATHNSSLTIFLRDHVIAPFADFMTRPHWLAVLGFVILYKLADAFMGIMFNPFLLDLGFTKSQIAEIVKIYGLAATLLGTFAGGWAVLRIGMFRTLLVCGALHMLTNLLLVVLARLGPDTAFLTLSIVLENFTGGMASAAFIAYLSALCTLHYTATQYALLSSLAAFGRSIVATPSGWIAQAFGWPIFFTFASVLGIPGLLLLCWLEWRKTRI